MENLSTEFDILTPSQTVVSELHLAAEQSSDYDKKHIELLRAAAALIAELEASSDRDKMTGAYSRNYFERIVMDQLERYLERGANERRNTSVKQIYLGIVDLDKLKEVNDSLGHDAGDKAIRTVASALQKSIRDTDLLIRLGGDEFLIVAQLGFESELAGSKVPDLISERAKEELEKESCPVSFSVGFVKLDNYNTWQEAFKSADKLMYSDKSTR